jgi:hypothetical protein
MTGPSIPWPSSIHPDNITHPSLDELSDEHKKTNEALKERRQRELDLLLKKKEEEFHELQKKEYKEDKQAIL